MIMLAGRGNMDEEALAKLSNPVSRALESEFVSSFTEKGFPEFSGVKRSFAIEK